MSYQITLDAGTTNTRAFLWKDGKVLLARQRRETGVACTAVDGSDRRLREAVRSCVEGLLLESGVQAAQVECILASGMITSNMGLKEIPHLTAPAGIDELARGIRREVFPDISPVPFFLIPGMKNRVPGLGPENFEAMDMMRGEETEAIALLAEMPSNGSYLLILPGSHTKFVKAEAGRLTACLTTLSGEILSVLTQQTLLADTVGKKFAEPETYREDMVKLGYETARKHGLSRAAFAARVLRLQTGKSQEEMASYLLGAVLEQDIRALKNAGALALAEQTRIVLSGKSIFRRAFQDILQADGSFSDPAVLEPKDGIPPAARGALMIYAKWKKSAGIKTEAPR